MIILRQTAGLQRRKRLPKPRAGGPLLIGVAHEPETKEKELQWLADRLRAMLPNSVGLELSEDYAQKRKRSVRTFFFDDAADIIGQIGMDIIPLEDPRLVEEQHAASLAFHLMEMGNEPADILEMIRAEAMVHRYTPPEACRSVRFKLDTLGAAYDILSRVPGREGLLELWESIRKKRERRMDMRIAAVVPEVVITGDAHAVVLMAQLQESGYQRSPFASRLYRRGARPPTGPDIRLFSFDIG